MTHDVPAQLRNLQRQRPPLAQLANPVREGFWCSSTEPDLPMPTPDAWVGPERERLMLALQWIENRLTPRRFRGWSDCRLCRCHNGSAEYNALGFVWPSGFAHYIRDHGVRPSEAFITAVLAEHGRYVTIVKP